MKQYPKEYFEFAKDRDYMHDKPLKTKQLTYFQDAMVRFGKNKYNVIATTILAILIIMSIFVPIFTPQRYYTETNDKLITLPPRVPFLEKFGIMDGSIHVEGQTIDYDTIDPETGLGYPTVGFCKEFIDFDTLENYIQFGNDKKPQFIGGFNELYVDTGKERFSIVSNEELSFNDTSTLEISINDIYTTGQLEVYYSPVPADQIRDMYTSWDELTLLATLDADGVHQINLSAFNLSSGYLVLSHNIGQENPDSSQFISLEYIKHTYVSQDETVEELFEGYSLAIFDMFALDETTENGRYNRKDSYRILSSFRYDKYGELLADQYAIIGDEEYMQILEDNPGMEESITIISDTEWTFDDGYPLTGVIDVDSIKIGLTTYTNYHVMMNGMYELGIDKEPYFYFGTDTLGMDLFSLIFLGLRTSLILGFIATFTNTFFGIIWGAISGYYGGQVDILMERFIDIWGSFPQITMIGIITSIIGTGFWALYIFLVYDGWIGAARITRMQFYRFKNREYVLAARTLGASDLRIIFKHILPNALGTIVTRMILAIPSVIFLELNLSYLGFGLGTGQKIPFGPIELTGTSIGIILKNGTSQIFVGNLWMIVYPALIVSILMITFNMFGNALRDALNPQLRGN